MDQSIVNSVALVGSTDMGDMTILALFLRAHWVVKIVLVMLFFASVWTWAIILDKMWRLRRLETRALKFEDAFWSGGSLDDLYERVGQRPSDPMTAVLSSAMREWRRSAARGSGRNRPRRGPACRRASTGSCR